MSSIPTITRASVSIGVAATATGFSSRSLRLALGTGGKVPLLGQVDRGVGGWRRFGQIDIPRLAVLSRLINHGLTVSAAAHVISTKIDPRLVGLVMCGIDLPASLILPRFLGAYLHVSLTASGEYVAAVLPHAAPTGRHDTTIVVDLEAVTATALSALPKPRPSAFKKELPL